MRADRDHGQRVRLGGGLQSPPLPPKNGIETVHRILDLSFAIYEAVTSRPPLVNRHS
jgi:hypothetical protein